MDNIIESIKEEVLNDIEEYKNTSTDNYDYYKEHIKYVYEESINLAKIYNADLNVVKLGALLHDIALIKRIGERKEHNVIGAQITKDILDKYDLDDSFKERVIGCVYNHRSSKNATNIEELCVCDADILAHFDNIPMIFNFAFNKAKVTINEINDWMRQALEDDYNDLSDKTKEIFKDRYQKIIDVVLRK